MSPTVGAGVAPIPGKAHAAFQCPARWTGCKEDGIGLGEWAVRHGYRSEAVFSWASEWSMDVSPAAVLRHGGTDD